MLDNLDKLRDAINAMREVRSDAKTKIIEAIRELEKSLQEALGDSTLRGMPNLGDKGMPIFGLVVRSPRKDRIRYPILGQTTNTLVLRPHGDLAMVEVTSTAVSASDEDLETSTRNCIDSDFMPSDLRLIVETVEQAVTTHLSMVDRTRDQWQLAGQLAERLMTVLDASAEPDDDKTQP